ncbi:MAG: DUF3793 family protein [Lachnospiraceae bacterium]|nr:DUF3793 family protein [Lachnospiraceae bacterium]
MRDKIFERSIVQNSAATLAGIKVGNLFNHNFASYEACIKAIEDANEELNSKDVYVELLECHDDFYLIYIYRKKLLVGTLKDCNVRALLVKYGYTGECDAEAVLGFLKKRIVEAKTFPHEIGVFLGYPIEDIKGFVRNRGRNCIMCGLWKVYSNPKKAKEYFCKIDKCNSIYMDVYCKGRSLLQMTVGA